MPIATVEDAFSTSNSLRSYPALSNIASSDDGIPLSPRSDNYSSSSERWHRIGHSNYIGPSDSASRPRVLHGYGSSESRGPPSRDPRPLYRPLRRQSPPSPVASDYPRYDERQFSRRASYTNPYAPPGYPSEFYSSAPHDYLGSGYGRERAYNPTIPPPSMYDDQPNIFASTPNRYPSNPFSPHLAPYSSSQYAPTLASVYNKPGYGTPGYGTPGHVTPANNAQDTMPHYLEGEYGGYVPRDPYAAAYSTTSIDGNRGHHQDPIRGARTTKEDPTAATAGIFDDFNSPGLHSGYKPPVDINGAPLKFDVPLSGGMYTFDAGLSMNMPKAAPKNIETMHIGSSRGYSDDDGLETVVLVKELTPSAISSPHIRWIHLHQDDMSLESLQKAILSDPTLRGDDELLALQLLGKIRDDNEKEFIHGHYLEPLVIRCDGRPPKGDVSEERYGTFLSFPYFSNQRAPSSTKKGGSHAHPVQGLLQTLYSLESMKARDSTQVISKAQTRGAKTTIHVPQLWAMILGTGTIITYSAHPLTTLRGKSIQVTQPISSIRKSPSVIHVTDPDGRLYFFSVDQCKTWFELSEILSAQCLPNDYDTLDRFQLLIKDGRPVTAETWPGILKKETSTFIDLRIQIRPYDGHSYPVPPYADPNYRMMQYNSSQRVHHPAPEPKYSSSYSMPPRSQNLFHSSSMAQPPLNSQPSYERPFIVHPRSQNHPDRIERPVYSMASYPNSVAYEPPYPPPHNPFSTTTAIQRHQTTASSVNVTVPYDMSNVLSQNPLSTARVVPTTSSYGGRLNNTAANSILSNANTNSVPYFDEGMPVPETRAEFQERMLKVELVSRRQEERFAQTASASRRRPQPGRKNIFKEKTTIGGNDGGLRNERISGWVRESVKYEQKATSDPGSDSSSDNAQRTLPNSGYKARGRNLATKRGEKKMKAGFSFGARGRESKSNEGNPSNAINDEWNFASQNTGKSKKEKPWEAVTVGLPEEGGYQSTKATQAVWPPKILNNSENWKKKDALWGDWETSREDEAKEKATVNFHAHNEQETKFTLPDLSNQTFTWRSLAAKKDGDEKTKQKQQKEAKAKCNDSENGDADMRVEEVSPSKASHLDSAHKEGKNPDRGGDSFSDNGARTKGKDRAVNVPDEPQAEAGRVGEIESAGSGSQEPFVPAFKNANVAIEEFPVYQKPESDTFCTENEDSTGSKSKKAAKSSRQEYCEIPAPPEPAGEVSMINPTFDATVEDDWMNWGRATKKDKKKKSKEIASVRSHVELKSGSTAASPLLIPYAQDADFSLWGQIGEAAPTIAAASHSNEIISSNNPTTSTIPDTTVDVEQTSITRVELSDAKVDPKDSGKNIEISTQYRRAHTPLLATSDAYEKETVRESSRTNEKAYKPTKSSQKSFTTNSWADRNKAMVTFERRGLFTEPERANMEHETEAENRSRRSSTSFDESLENFLTRGPDSPKLIEYNDSLAQNDPLPTSSGIHRRHPSQNKVSNHGYTMLEDQKRRDVVPPGMIINRPESYDFGEDVYYNPQHDRLEEQDVPEFSITVENATGAKLPSDEHERVKSDRSPFAATVEDDLEPSDLANPLNDSSTKGSRSSSPSPANRKNVTLLPILMWPTKDDQEDKDEGNIFSRTTDTTKQSNQSTAPFVRRRTDSERRQSNDVSVTFQSLTEVLERIHERLLSDVERDHCVIYRNVEEGQVKDSSFILSSPEVPEPDSRTLRTELGATGADSKGKSVPIPRLHSTLNVDRGKHRAHGTAIPDMEPECQKLLEQFSQSSNRLLAAFAPPGFSHVVIGKYYGAVKTVIEIFKQSQEQYSMGNKARLAHADAQRTLWMVQDLTLDTIEKRRLPVMDQSFSECPKCIAHTIYESQKEVREHLRIDHFKSMDPKVPPTSVLANWIIRLDSLADSRRFEEQKRILKASYDHVASLEKAVDQIQDGVSTPDQNHSVRFRLPRSFILGFRGLVLLLLYTVHVLRSIDKKSDWTYRWRWNPANDNELLTASAHMERIGYDAQEALAKGKIDLKMMITTRDFTQSVTYEAVGPQYVLAMMLGNLQAGVDNCDLWEVYKDYTDRLAFQVSQRPRRRLLRDFFALSEEISAICATLERQDRVIHNFNRVLAPSSFRLTSCSRHSLYALETRLLHKSSLQTKKKLAQYMELKQQVDRQIGMTKMGIEILDDDHGKAILVFTIVTLVFLPLSFVTSFLGMNTVDIRNQDSTQVLFWEVALPITAAVIGLALLIGYKLEAMREWAGR